MKERFEYRKRYDPLAIGILNCMLGIASSYLGLPNSWFGLGWCLIGLFWILRFRSGQKHGYLQIDDTHIQINYTGFAGIKKVLINDIDKVVFKPRFYRLDLVSERKRRIYKGNLAKESIPLLEEVLNSINNGNLSERKD